MIVFKILNKVSGQHYVGSCRGDIFERWQLYLNAAEAGLDFPLYKEIREHGEAQFTIAELDFAEDISELKEMELLHTIELNARSLRSHKFGLSENVVKRRRQLAHENAWKKEIPAEDKPLAPAPVSKPVVSKTAIRKPAIKKDPISSKTITGQLRDKTSAAASQFSTPKTATRTATKTTVKTSIVAVTDTSKKTAVKLSTPPAKSIDTQKPDNSKLQNQNADDELQKTLFAESVGLLVRTLSSVEQINSQQQRARDEAESLSQALIASDNALQQLLQQQQQAAVMAKQAMAAVEASQQANQALISAQQQALQCSASTLDALDKNQQNLDQNQLLQQQLTDLLGRLKNSSATRSTQSIPSPEPMEPRASKPEPSISGSSLSAATHADPLVAEAPSTGLSPSTASTAPKSTTQPLSVVTHTALVTKTVTKPAVVSDDDDEAQRQLLQAEESKMVNQLKQLDQLLETPSTLQDHQQEGQPAQGSVQDPAAPPATAWVAASGKEADSAQLVTRASSAAKVIHRRSRNRQTELRSQSLKSDQSPHPNGQTPLQNARKTLTIKARG